jgi:hypothetical protein
VNLRKQSFWGYSIVAHILLLQGCSLGQTNPTRSIEKAENEELSQESVLEHIHHSYTLGCAEAYKSQKMKNFYEACNRKGAKHAQEVRTLLQTKDEP